MVILGKLLIQRWPALGYLVGPAGMSGVFSVVNLLTTVLIVRLFGEIVYVRFTVDLAVLSLSLVVLELVPSNYVIFRLQDDFRWTSALGPQLIINILLGLFVLWVIGAIFNSFSDFSIWILFYAISMAVKRQFDLTLQSSGRLSQFFAIEALAATLRLLLLIIFVWAGFVCSAALWASLAIGMLSAQVFWVLRDPETFAQLKNITKMENWNVLWSEKKNYGPYYMNIALKRVRDSLAPIAAARIISDKSELAAFLLAYRGVLAVMAQARLVEGVLNHRPTQVVLSKLKAGERLFVAGGCQALCVAASALIILSSGIADPPWVTVCILSGLAWPTTLMMQERARAHSEFRPEHVTRSLIAYIGIIAIAVVLFDHFFNPGAVIFALILLTADSASWFAIASLSRK